MEIIPSVDISNGVCVKLIQGRLGTGIIVSKDPVNIAKRWEEMGAKRLHVVDLDGAKCGTLQNLDVIAKILRTVNCQVEVGGGIRTVREALKVVNLGARWVIVSTRAMLDFSFLQSLARALNPSRLLLSLDVLKGKVMVEGWEKEVNIDPVSVINKVNKNRIAGIIITSIDKEGTLSGVNLDLINLILEESRVPVYYAGGVSSVGDLDLLYDLGIAGVIIGMALYAGTINFKEVLARYDSSS